MSITAYTPPESHVSDDSTYDCGLDECPADEHSVGVYHCDRHGCLALFEEADAFHGSFCSDVCYYRHKGYGAFDNIVDDHQWCSTCFRRIKDVEPWPLSLLAGMYPETEKAAKNSGFQYERPNMVWATDQFDTPNPYLLLEGQRWGCDCGDVSGTAQEFAIRKADPAATLASLYHCLQELADDDNIANEPSKDALFEAFRERQLDWPYIAGRAIYTQ